MNDISVKMMGHGELLSKSFQFFKQRWQVLVLISLVPVALFIVLTVISVVLGVAGVVSFAALAQENSSFATGGPLFLLSGVFVLYILIIIITLWSQVATLIVISRPDEWLGVSQAYGLAKGRIWPYFATTFIIGLLTFPGYLLFVIPGVVLAIWFAFGPIISVKEDVQGLDAALTSRGLVRGWGWAVFGRFVALIAGYIVIYIVLLVLQTSLWASDDAQGLALVGGLIMQIIMQVIFYVLNMIALIYTYFMYQNLRELHGGEIIIAPSTRKKYVWFGAIGFILGIVLFLGLIVVGVMGAVTLRNNSPVPYENETDLFKEDVNSENI